VVSNIVEGCARSAQGDYIRFLDTAFGSARELEYQLTIAARLEYLTAATADELAQLSNETTRVLGALLQALRRENQV
jgi:four helix bundle protein